MSMQRTLVAVWMALALGQYGGASRADERSDYPPAARSLYERGQDLLQKGLYKEAVEAFEQAIAKGMKDFPRVHLSRARSNLGSKDYDAAIARYTEFIEEFGLEASCRH